MNGIIFFPSENFQSVNSRMGSRTFVGSGLCNNNINLYKAVGHLAVLFASLQGCRTSSHFIYIFKRLLEVQLFYTNFYKTVERPPLTDFGKLLLPLGLDSSNTLYGGRGEGEEKTQQGINSRKYHYTALHQRTRVQVSPNRKQQQRQKQACNL